MECMVAVGEGGFAHLCSRPQEGVMRCMVFAGEGVSHTTLMTAIVALW